MKRTTSSALRFLALLALCTVALQLVFGLRIALMTFVDPQSTSFQRSEMWRLLVEQHEVRWSQRWIAGAQISPRHSPASMERSSTRERSASVR